MKVLILIQLQFEFNPVQSSDLLSLFREANLSSRPGKEVTICAKGLENLVIFPTR